MPTLTHEADSSVARRRCSVVVSSNNACFGRSSNFLTPKRGNHLFKLRLVLTIPLCHKYRGLVRLLIISQIIFEFLQNYIQLAIKFIFLTFLFNRHLSKLKCGQKSLVIIAHKLSTELMFIRQFLITLAIVATVTAAVVDPAHIFSNVEKRVCCHSHLQLCCYSRLLRMIRVYRGARRTEKLMIICSAKAITTTTAI